MEIGVDIIEIDRIQQALVREEAFLQKILTPEEIELCRDFGHHERRLAFVAGRFAAKEAYAKALGTGFVPLKFTDLEILADPHGRPLISKGPLADLSKVSISHSQNYAVATVLIDQSLEEIRQKVDEFLAK